jgi:hypothetical protein
LSNFMGAARRKLPPGEVFMIPKEDVDQILRSSLVIPSDVQLGACKVVVPGSEYVITDSGTNTMYTDMQDGDIVVIKLQDKRYVVSQTAVTDDSVWTVRVVTDNTIGHDSIDADSGQLVDGTRPSFGLNMSRVDSFTIPGTTTILFFGSVLLGSASGDPYIMTLL